MPSSPAVTSVANASSSNEVVDIKAVLASKAQGNKKKGSSGGDSKKVDAVALAKKEASERVAKGAGDKKKRDKSKFNELP